MAITRIRNLSANPIGLPPPYRGFLGPGESTYVRGDVPTTISNFGGAASIASILDVLPDVDNAFTQAVASNHDMGTVPIAISSITAEPGTPVGITGALVAADPGSDIVVNTGATRTAGKIFTVRNFGVNLFDVMPNEVDLYAWGSGAGQTMPLAFWNLANTHFVAFKASDAIGANVTWTLPATDGAAGTQLTTNGLGVLSWATGGTITGPGTSTVNALVRWNNATGTLVKDSSAVLSDTAALDLRAATPSLSLKSADGSSTFSAFSFDGTNTILNSTSAANKLSFQVAGVERGSFTTSRFALNQRSLVRDVNTDRLALSGDTLIVPTTTHISLWGAGSVNPFVIDLQSNTVNMRLVGSPNNPFFIVDSVTQKVATAMRDISQLTAGTSLRLSGDAPGTGGNIEMFSPTNANPNAISYNANIHTWQNSAGSTAAMDLNTSVSELRLRGANPDLVFNSADMLTNFSFFRFDGTNTSVGASASGGNFNIFALGTLMISLKSGLVELEQSNVFRNVQNDSLILNGGTTVGSDAILQLYGSTHATFAQQVHFQSGRIAFSNSDASITGAELFPLIGEFRLRFSSPALQLSSADGATLFSTLKFDGTNTVLQATSSGGILKLVSAGTTLFQASIYSWDNAAGTTTPMDLDASASTLRLRGATSGYFMNSADMLTNFSSFTFDGTNTNLSASASGGHVFINVGGSANAEFTSTQITLHQSTFARNVQNDAIIFVGGTSIATDASFVLQGSTSSSPNNIFFRTVISTFQNVAGTATAMDVSSSTSLLRLRNTTPELRLTAVNGTTLFSSFKFDGTNTFLSSEASGGNLNLVANGTLLTSMTSAGAVSITPTSNLGIFNTTPATAGFGTNTIVLNNASVAPTASNASGGILYATGGALHWRGSGGTDTVIATA